MSFLIFSSSSSSNKQVHCSRSRSSNKFIVSRSSIKIESILLIQVRRIRVEVVGLGMQSKRKTFKPVRFIDEDVSIMGSDLRLAPFGSGRRVCPGRALGLATVHLWLARMLHQFKWLPAQFESVDLSEHLRLSLSGLSQEFVLAEHD